MKVSTVGELLDFLSGYPRDRKVILSKDAEGNGHSPLDDAEEAMYVADTPYAGTSYITPEELAEMLAGDNPQGFTEEDAPPPEAERVVVLWPAN